MAVVIGLILPTNPDLKQFNTMILTESGISGE